jgi:hypothetical protein
MPWKYYLLAILWVATVTSYAPAPRITPHAHAALLPAKSPIENIALSPPANAPRPGLSSRNPTRLTAPQLPGDRGTTVALAPPAEDIAAPLVFRR